jgi:hypothetical protein
MLLISAYKIQLEQFIKSIILLENGLNKSA